MIQSMKNSLMRDDFTNEFNGVHTITIIGCQIRHVPHTATRTDSNQIRIAPMIVLGMQSLPTKRFGSNRFVLSNITTQIVMPNQIFSNEQIHLDRIALKQNHRRHDMACFISKRAVQSNSAVEKIGALRSIVGCNELHAHIDVDSLICSDSFHLPWNTRHPPHMEEIVVHHLHHNVARRLNSKRRNRKSGIRIDGKGIGGSRGRVLKQPGSECVF